MGKIGLERFDSDGINRDRAGGSIVSVGMQQLGQASDELSLLFVVKLLEVAAVIGVRPTVENENRFPMQPVGRPVGSDIAAVSPDGADFHPTHRLPDVLTGTDLTFANERHTIDCHHLLRNWRHLRIDASTDPTKDQKRQDHHRHERYPQSFHVFLTLLRVAGEKFGCWQRTRRKPVGVLSRVSVHSCPS